MPSIPNNPCEELDPKRPTPLGITQEESCVTWDVLVALRQLYNGLFWERLDLCGMAEGDKYGTPPFKEETELLPTMVGCFRADVHIEQVGDDEACQVVVDYVRFLLTGGTLLDLLEDTDYSYLANTLDGPFYAKLEDECYVCGKFRPISWADAAITIECPDGTPTTYHDGYKLLVFGSAPDACNIQTDFGNKIADFEEIVKSFPGCIVTDKTDDSQCVKTQIYCCANNAYAYYDAWEHPSDPTKMILKLKMVQLGDEQDYNGILTPFIKASRVENVKERFMGDMEAFFPAECQTCDGCGPAGGREEFCQNDQDNPDGLAFTCLSDTPFNWDDVVKAVAVQGTDKCEPCADGFGGTICTCPWEELAQAMIFVSANGCVKECEDCSCSCSSSSSSSDSSSDSGSDGSGSGSDGSGNPPSGDPPSGDPPSGGDPSDGSGGFSPPP